VVADLLGACAQLPEDLDHDLHVLDFREVAQGHRLAGEQGGRQAGQGRVLVAAGPQAAAQGVSAFDQVFEHRLKAKL
jgi:hypothetical protein